MDALALRSPPRGAWGSRSLVSASVSPSVEVGRAAVLKCLAAGIAILAAWAAASSRMTVAAVGLETLAVVAAELALVVPHR